MLKKGQSRTSDGYPRIRRCPPVVPGPGAGAGNKSNQGAVQLLQPDLWPHYTAASAAPAAPAAPAAAHVTP